MSVTEDEQSEQRRIADARQRLQDDATAAEAGAGRRLDAAIRALTDLPPPFDTDLLSSARRAVDVATSALQSAERRHLDAVGLQAQLAALSSQARAARAEQAQQSDRSTRIEQALSQWSLLARCPSNDGVIALDIDDAGPTFAALANDLLLACDGSRFTLEVRTQTATAKGEMREDFDIVVHDGLRGEAKSLKLVSGGERVWINECLRRAIALYLAGNTGRRFGALFSDEVTMSKAILLNSDAITLMTRSEVQFDLDQRKLVQLPCGFLIDILIKGVTTNDGWMPTQAHLDFLSFLRSATAKWRPRTLDT